MEIKATVQGDGWGILIHPDWQKDILQSELSLVDSFSPAIFRAECYGTDAKRVSVGGRNAAWFIPTAIGPAVLRYYRRGGLIGKFNRSKYFYTNPQGTRAFQEFTIINYLHQAGLSVPKALGAFYQKKGLFCEMALITSLIEDTQPLAMICQQLIDAEIRQEEAERYARSAAYKIHQMHDLDVLHADLNAFNILCSSDPINAYLIDFDKAKKIKLDHRLRQQNLDRLARSLKKVCGEQSIVFMEQILQNYHHFE